MVHSHVSPRVLTHGLQHVSHFPCEEEVTLMSCGVGEDGFLSLHRSGRVRFYTADGYLREPPARSTVPYEGVAFTQIPGRLVGWGPGEKLTLLDTKFTPVVHAQETLDIRVCQMLEGSRELVTAGAGNVCVWSVGHMVMVCHVQVVDGFERECVFTQLALVPATAQKAPRALAVCGRSVTVVDLREGCVLEHKTNLHRREITALVYCPLQDVVVTASKDVTMRVWGSDWELLTAFVGHTAVVTSLLLCPISGLLLSASLDSTLRYWSLQTGDQVRILTPPIGYAPAILVGGPSSMSTFFTFSKSGVDFWTFNSLYDLHCKLSGDSAISRVREIRAPSSGPHYPARVVCVHGDSDITLMAAGTGAVLTAFRTRERVRCADYCLYKEVLMVLTDEGSVIKASTLTNPVTRVDTWTNRESGQGEACCMALYSHIADEETALEEWKELQEERGEKPRVRKQLEEGKNRFLVILGHHSGCVSVMQMHSGRVQYKLTAHNGQDITSIQAYPESDYVLTAGADNSVLLWRVFPYTQDCLSVQTSVFCAQTPVCMSLLDSLLAVGLQHQHSATYSLVQLDLHTHTPTHTRCDHPPEHDHSGAITGLCVCPNLHVFASCSQDGTLRLWDEENRLLRTLELNAEPECVQFSGQGGELLLGIRGDVYRIHCTHLLPPEFQTLLLCNEDLYDPVPDLPIACTISKSCKQRGESSHITEAEFPEKQDQTKDPMLECLLERNRDLSSLQSGDTHSRRKLKSTPHTRREAFNRYIQLLYNPALQISIPDEDPFDLHAALSPPKPPQLRPLTPPTLREGFFPNWSLARKPDATHTQEGVPSRPPTASLGFVPNSVLVGQIWPDEVLQNAVPSTPWTLRDEHTHRFEKRKEDTKDQCLYQEDDDEFSMNSIIHLIGTSPETKSPTPPPRVTPPPEEPSPEKPKYTLKPLKPHPPIKINKPLTPPKPAPPTAVHTPTPPLPHFLKQFLQEGWFHCMYPDPGCIPESLTLTEFCAQLLDFLKRCVMDQKLCVLKAIITLHTHNSLNNTHTITHSLLDSLRTCLHKDMSDMEQRFAVELLNFLVCVNPHSYDITVEILLLLADKELRLQGVAVCMLQALGVDEAQQWLRPQLESWDLEAHEHAEPRRCLRELAHHWLNSWTAKYKIHKSAGKKSALFSLVISPSDVLRYFCWVQKEAQVKPAAEARGRRDTVLLGTQPYREI
ncbi:WD repeat-containing protein 97 isoform X2 [Ictalurus furcatus]|uniref:WD repeat-containing protein 97 isoform X2 n=1 Tax=Ictalurus furcatus TaxID=66913 RepID=UPI0023505216|nr:WD repeat-containing protein 97 isoform X2 [Ictalurus furcatus]